MEITARPGADADRRRAILERWYRAQLKHDLAPLLSKWETAIGVKTASWGVRKMRTRWGSCNPKAKRLWFNLELAKKSLDCLEYVVVHELDPSPGAAPRCTIQGADDQAPARVEVHSRIAQRRTNWGRSPGSYKGIVKRKV